MTHSFPTLRSSDLAFNGALPWLHIDDGVPVIPGQPSYEGARTALQSLEISAGLARSCSAGGIITAPVSKKQLYSVGFTHAGQTEFIAERCGVAKSRSEEHTSELQSLMRISYAVFCLKKKK